MSVFRSTSVYMYACMCACMCVWEGVDLYVYLLGARRPAPDARRPPHPLPLCKSKGGLCG